MDANSYSHADGGSTKNVGLVLTQKLEVLAILKGGGQNVHPLKEEGGGAHNDLPCLERGGGGCKQFLTRDFPILQHPLPVIDNQSLNVPLTTSLGFVCPIPAVRISITCSQFVDAHSITTLEVVFCTFCECNPISLK